MNKYKTLILFIAIILIAASLRLYRINQLGTFLADQAIELEGTYQILQGKFTLIGIKTSVSEIRNGAVMYYLMAPILYLLKFDPVAGGVFQTVLQLGAILLIYLPFKYSDNQNIGLFSVVFMALSPLLVRYSRQTMLAYFPLFFSTFTFFVSLKLVQHFQKTLCLIFGFLLGFTLQIHYSALALIIYAFLIPWLFIERKLILKYFIFILFGFFIGFLPMIIFELRHEFFQTKMLFSFISSFNQPGPHSQFNLLNYWRNSIAQLFFAGNGYLSIIYLTALLPALLIYRNKLKIFDKLSVLQIISTFIFTALIVRENVSHYLITSFIPLFILTASFIEKLRNTFKFVPIYPLVIFTMLFLFLYNLSAYGLLENHGWTMTEGWNLPGTKKSAEIIFTDIKKQNEKNYNVVMIVDAQNQGLPIRYFLNIWNIAPLSVNQYDKAKYLYILSQPGILLEKIKIWELSSFGKYNIDKTWPVQNGFTLIRLSKKSISV